MANQNALKQTNGTDVHVVAPQNMGKGLLYDPNTKQYYVAIDDRTFDIDELGRLKLRVSALEDNQLQLRDDGVYQGSSAPKELAHLYVDAVNGIDQNPFEVKGAGTRAKPLRTFKYANDLAKIYTTRTIYLREAQEHIVDKQVNVLAGTLNISAYGEQIDALISSVRNAFVAFHRISQNPLLRPKLVLKAFSMQPYYGAGSRFDIPTFTSIHLNDKVNFSTSGIEIVNDLGFSVNFQIFEDQGDRKERMVKPFRIQTAPGNVTATIVNTAFSDRGVPNVTGEFIQNEDKVFDLKQRDNKNRYRMGLFYNDAFLSMQIRNITYEVTDSYLFGVVGWGVPMTSDLTITAVNDQDKLAELIHNPSYIIQPSGDKIITSPSTNIEPKWFKI